MTPKKQSENPLEILFFVVMTVTLLITPFLMG